MITLNELCKQASNSNTTTVSLGHACALPRSPVDMSPLPEPHCEFAFDSSWEALFTGTDAAGEGGSYGQTAVGAFGDR